MTEETAKALIEAINGLVRVLSPNGIGVQIHHYHHETPRVGVAPNSVPHWGMPNWW